MTMQDYSIIEQSRKREGAIALLGLILMALIAGSCDSTSQYRRLVSNQLESGVINDTIFHGVHFGMTYDEYYDHITELGHQGIVSQGGDMSVQYEIEAYENTIHMNFVPEYLNDSIQEMRVTYSYANWSPWNRQTTDDNLWEDVLDLYKIKYGQKYIQLKSERSIRPAYVWVIGNQRISLFQNSEARIDVKITNLRKING